MRRIPKHCRVTGNDAAESSLTGHGVDAIICGFIWLGGVDRWVAGSQSGNPHGGQPQRIRLHAMEIFHQLGNLTLQAVPTVVIVFLFYAFLRANFFKPLEGVLAERSARIEGARAEAAAAQAAAKQELDSYNEALKKARAGIYAEQETARQAVLDERARLLRAMRNRSQETVQAAKQRIAAELEAARAQLEQRTPELASEIARLILERPSAPLGGAR